MLSFFDSHAHYMDERFDEDRNELLISLNKEENVEYIMNVSYDIPSSYKTVELCDKYNFCLGAVGVHPHDADSVTNSDYDLLRKLCEHKKILAIGETGLDYYDNQSTRAQQIEVLNWHFDLAMELNKPVQLHIRNAHGDVIDLMRTRQKEGRLPRCFVHCFTRSYELAKVYLSLGCYISIAGTVTYTNANRLLETVRMIPIDRLLIEIDAPWVAPEPYRGSRCEPAYILKTFEKIAELRKMHPEELSRQLWKNTIELLEI